MEPLEDRCLFSVAVPTAAAAPISSIPTTPITVTNGAVLTGTLIHAEAGQAFRAVIGTIRNLQSLPAGYSLHGSINWGDATPPSAAQFVAQPNGLIDVLGAHTYVAAGSDAINVAVTAVPPAGSLAPVIVIGSFQSKADVITPDGGVTLNETAGVTFTAHLGTFQSTLSSSWMTAVISWGDGTQSIGKIIALPTTGPIGGFAVYGSHRYPAPGSYAAHITVTYRVPPSIVSTVATTTPVIVVAQIDSVIDVLPVLSTATGRPSLVL
jgi:hypothetical protein